MEPVLVAPSPLGGMQHVYRFANGWGASVIVHGPRIELMPTRPVGEDPDDFYLVEDDPLIGSWLSEEEVESVLAELAARPWPGLPDLTERWQSAR
jgi:hypothetical protein